ncbi:Uu.00g119370.m01.CDS01 [Anthostomella pinea]|uniref:Uu.00g119370.m01.CDS01 n=1 Tax=Anthostomella pinea TaxID=933095 RepID=A0AAI8YEP9_9PEZI|nr:Uu.00g119370.m01.CDS01 [Anthostomella pinea]
MSTSRPDPEEVEENHFADLYVDAVGDEDEEDDPDYDDEDELEHDLEEDEFHDAEEGHIEFVVQMDDEEEEEEEDDDDDEGEEEGGITDAERLSVQQRVINLITTGRTGLLSQRQLLDYLRRQHLGHVLFDEDADDGGGGGGLGFGHRPRRRRALDPERFPKVPSDEGRDLMNSGTFGTNDIQSPIRTKKQLSRRIVDRELGIGGRTHRRVDQGVMAQSMIPSTDADMTINYDDNVYSGQFSDDGNFFYSCVKDFKVRMYDTSNPYNWRHYKTVSFPFGSWTLTDASLSPDNKWLAYTSIQSNVCLAPTDPNDTGDPYTLSLSEHGAQRQAGWRRSFGIWSIRFSGDGRELVAGTNANSIIVYDIESRRVLHQIEGHEDDVNAVCFADKSSPHILYSGSDDATIKVWDRRSMGDGREAGAFVGHIEGLTYLDSKDDGRYLLSNGKDQSMKLWDLKMMYTTAQFQEMNPRQHTRYSEFDYRWGKFDDADWFPHPNDNSVVTFRGHKVLRTLIRCHFSPPSSTNSRYVYSGSHDGKVYVYNMDATIAGIIDVRKTTSHGRQLPSYLGGHGDPGWTTIVRDASWHPNAPFIAASSLNGWDHSSGTVTLHSYNESSVDEGEPRMGTGYDEKLRPVSLYTSGDEEDDDDEESDGDYEDPFAVTFTT